MSEQLPRKKRILSGIQPTGTFTLGNYVGAVRNWGALQTEEHECLYMIADLHALTVRQEPAKLRRKHPRGGGHAAGRRYRPGPQPAVCAEPCTRPHPAELGAELLHPIR